MSRASYRRINEIVMSPPLVLIYQSLWTRAYKTNFCSTCALRCTVITIITPIIIIIIKHLNVYCVKKNYTACTNHQFSFVARRGKNLVVFSSHCNNNNRIFRICARLCGPIAYIILSFRTIFTSVSFYIKNTLLILLLTGAERQYSSKQWNIVHNK